VAGVYVGLLDEGRVVVPAHVVTMEMGTPACSIRVSVVCQESCRPEGWTDLNKSGCLMGATD
jgi:hypothetical protein